VARHFRALGPDSGPATQEKALVANAAWATEKHLDLKRVLDALLEACAWLDRPDNFGACREDARRRRVLEP
jgi:ABC-type nitrate/sulfonate/bicarbonate transport system substrate-binding protein